MPTLLNFPNTPISNITKKDDLTPEWVNFFTVLLKTLSYVRVGRGAPTSAPALPTDGSILLYLRIDGGAGTTLYICEGGAWTGK